MQEFIKKALESVATEKVAFIEHVTPTPNPAATKGRSEHEALTTGGEKANVEGNVDALNDYLADFGECSHHDKDIIKQLFSHGRPGEYVTRSKTLIEKTAELLKKA